MLRSARSFMSTQRRQLIVSGSIPSSLPCSRCASSIAASRLFAAPIAWMSPVKWRFMSSIGTTCAKPPPVAPPLIPNTGPSEASRTHSTELRPIAPRPCVSETEVVVLPSPAFVGVIAVTQTSFASGRSASRSRTERFTLPLKRPYWSSSSGSSPAAAAISAMGRSCASWAISSEDGMWVATGQRSSVDVIDEKNMSKISLVQSLADKAYHAIRDLIVSLELAPGAVIDERELVERLEIGRTPVREALRRLAQERLVEVYPRRGMLVTRVDVRELARLSEVRLVLEPEAARLAAERATEADREELGR